LDDGLCLYLFIAKKCDENLMVNVFGKSKLSKQESLT